MKNYWASVSDLQKLSGVDETTFEINDLDKPDWVYIRSLPSDVQKKIRNQWEEANPHKDYDLDPSGYIEGKVSNAKLMIEKHAKKWKVNDESIQVQWNPDWVTTGTWEQTEEDKEKSTKTAIYKSKWVPDPSNLPEMNDFMEIAFNEGFFPEGIDNLPSEIEQMTDRDVLIKKMGLTEKQADYVIMLKEAQEHLRKLNKIRNGW